MRLNPVTSAAFILSLFSTPIVLAAIWSSTAFAVSALKAVPAFRTIPVIGIDSFVPGMSWIWDYVEPSGRVYSTEKYIVLARKNQSVLIEMSADYNGGENLKPHHRILVDLEKCLYAYSNPHQKKPWRFAMFYLAKDKAGAESWVEIDQPNTLAFEEKFNCNPHIYSKASAPYLTVFDTLEGQPIFSHKLWRKVEGSWFALGGPESAVAQFKNFSNDPGQLYKMKLRAQGAR